MRKKQITLLIILTMLLLSILPLSVNAGRISNAFANSLRGFENLLRGGLGSYEKTLLFFIFFLLFFSAYLIGMKKAFNKLTRPHMTFAFAAALLSSIAIVYSKRFSFINLSYILWFLIFVVILAILYSIISKIIKNKLLALILGILIIITSFWLLRNLAEEGKPLEVLGDFSDWVGGISSIEKPWPTEPGTIPRKQAAGKPKEEQPESREPTEEKPPPPSRKPKKASKLNLEILKYIGLAIVAVAAIVIGRAYKKSGMKERQKSKKKLLEKLIKIYKALKDEGVFEEGKQAYIDTEKNKKRRKNLEEVLKKLKEINERIMENIGNTTEVQDYKALLKEQNRIIEELLGILDAIKSNRKIVPELEKKILELYGCILKEDRKKIEIIIKIYNKKRDAIKAIANYLQKKGAQRVVLTWLLNVSREYISRYNTILIKTISLLLKDRGNKLIEALNQENQIIEEITNAIKTQEIGKILDGIGSLFSKIALKEIPAAWEQFGGIADLAEILKEIKNNAEGIRKKLENEIRELKEQIRNIYSGKKTAIRTIATHLQRNDAQTLLPAFRNKQALNWLLNLLKVYIVKYNSELTGNISSLLGDRGNTLIGILEQENQAIKAIISAIETQETDKGLQDKVYRHMPYLFRLISEGEIPAAQEQLRGIAGLAQILGKIGEEAEGIRKKLEAIRKELKRIERSEEIKNNYDDKKTAIRTIANYLQEKDAQSLVLDFRDNNFLENWLKRLSEYIKYYNTKLIKNISPLLGDRGNALIGILEEENQAIRAIISAIETQEIGKILDGIGSLFSKIALKEIPAAWEQFGGIADLAEILKEIKNNAEGIRKKLENEIRELKEQIRNIYSGKKTAIRTIANYLQEKDTQSLVLALKKKDFLERWVNALTRGIKEYNKALINIISSLLGNRGNTLIMILEQENQVIEEGIINPDKGKDIDIVLGHMIYLFERIITEIKEAKRQLGGIIGKDKKGNDILIKIETDAERIIKKLEAIRKESKRIRDILEAIKKNYDSKKTAILNIAHQFREKGVQILLPGSGNTVSRTNIINLIGRLIPYNNTLISLVNSLLGDRGNTLIGILDQENQAIRAIISAIETQETGKILDGIGSLFSKIAEDEIPAAWEQFGGIADLAQILEEIGKDAKGIREKIEAIINDIGKSEEEQIRENYEVKKEAIGKIAESLSEERRDKTIKGITKEGSEFHKNLSSIRGANEVLIHWIKLLLGERNPLIKRLKKENKIIKHINKLLTKQPNRKFKNMLKKIIKLFNSVADGEIPAAREQLGGIAGLAKILGQIESNTATIIPVLQEELKRTP